MITIVPKSLQTNVGLRSLGRVLSFINKNEVDSQRRYHEATGDVISPGLMQGMDHIRNPRLNKGLAFTLKERQALGIHGLMPPRFKTQEQQVAVCLYSVNKYQEDINKYMYLAELHVGFFCLLISFIFSPFFILFYFIFNIYCRIVMKDYFIVYFLKM